MTDDLISTIQSFTLDARKLLEQETEEQLQGLYGWLPDGSFAAGTALGLAEAAETRARLEAYVEGEAEAGVDVLAAREKIKRETAFTWLNRAVAFRLMEERGIIKGTFGKLHKANAFIFYLTDVLNEASIPASTPINTMGEGPVDSAYRKFLLWQCGELTREVSVLFDFATLASRLCPRPAILKQLADTMNEADLVAAWNLGNEETLGWVYQGFCSQELQDAFAAARESKKKFESKDIPAVTQLFTIRWVVRFLVENTLGRIWMEMHPESHLSEILEYIVPPKEKRQRKIKPVKEITFLDPCCGSMHFGLLAFDLFSEMYREEMENAGKPGWPDSPSAGSEEEIPGLILTHNIHGIDIDLRAVQVSALALLLRARTLNPKAQVTDENLACANVEEFTGGRLDELINAAEFENRSEERILRAMSARVADSPHLGSLLRIERDLKEMVETERKTLLASSQPELLLAGLTDDLFESTRDLDSFFDQLASSIADRLDSFARDAGSNSHHAAAEASKGMRFLRLVEKRYDVVVTNPPYLSGRKMNKRLSVLMEQEYNEGKGDMYAAFILRCQELLAADGLMGMLTMHSFMFISSYEELRIKLRKEVAIETLAHFGGGLFSVGNPGTLQTAAFVLRQEPEASQREEQVGTYFRLVKERNAEAKRIAIESSLASLRQGEAHSQVFHYKQCDFEAIPGKPWVYWMTSSIRDSFLELQKIGDVATTAVGQNTGDNLRFLRFWWEPGRDRIFLDCPDLKQAIATGGRWFPYMKGGKPIPWWGNQTQCINWAHDGSEVKALAVIRNNGKHWSRYLQNLDYLFLRGATWSDISTKGFAARVSPGGFIHDVKGMGCYPREVGLEPILAILNSRFSKYILSGLNPTVSYQAGDVKRLPIPSKQNGAVSILVNQCIDLARQDGRESEITYDFIQPLSAVADRAARTEQLAALEAEIDTEVSRLYGLSEEDLIDIDRELNGTAASGCDDDAAVDTEAETEAGDEDETAGDLTKDVWARSWLSYALGTVLGRFELGKPGGLGCGDFPEATVAEIRNLIDPDGIMPCETGHPQDIATRAVACLELMLGATEAHKAIHSATETEGDPVEALRGWLDRFTGTPDKSFWKYHHQLYRKRPVYWPFQSPKNAFTVWVFHEKIGANTLHTLKQLADEHLNLIERRITDLRPTAATNRAAEKQLQKLLDEGDDVRDFSARLKAHIDAGYESCIDDGALLNAAPLHDLLSWPETRAAWKELEAGKYDWAHQAMRYWPNRVTDACRANRSFAIAHNLEHLCPAAPPKAGGKRGRKAKQAGLL